MGNPMNPSSIGTVADAEALLRSRVSAEREHCIKHGRALDVADVMEAARPLLEEVERLRRLVGFHRHAEHEGDRAEELLEARVAQLEAALRRIEADECYDDTLHPTLSTYVGPCVIARAALEGK